MLPILIPWRIRNIQTARAGTASMPEIDLVRQAVPGARRSTAGPGGRLRCRRRNVAEGMRQLEAAKHGQFALTPERQARALGAGDLIPPNSAQSLPGCARSPRPRAGIIASEVARGAAVRQYPLPGSALLTNWLI